MNKKGYVYFIEVRGGNTESIVKIGMTQNLPVDDSNPNKSCRFRSWTIFPPDVVKVNMIGYCSTNDRREAEKHFHQAFNQYKVQYSNEFFKIDKSKIAQVLSQKRQWITDYDIQLNWTYDLLEYDYSFQCFRLKREDKTEDHKYIRAMNNGKVVLRKLY